jgi:hypothetical protein
MAVSIDRFAAIYARAMRDASIEPDQQQLHRDYRRYVSISSLLDGSDSSAVDPLIEVDRDATGAIHIYVGS